ncbi:SNF2-related protein [Aureimonas psammosilenae]|uniref:SNF2-related protein n=1 Tax=Aureimonas psammosilenae TaxID=2495496 RepID=UPI00126041CE|nr:DEAD/DEAH box helicase [Aureimonas psammosilenae]
MRICATTEPMLHQRAAVEKIAPSRVGGLFMDMGTGKSLTAIMLAEMRQAAIDKVWWGCPCALRQTIVEQILKHTTATAEDVHVLTSASREEDILRASWIVFGIESVGQSDAVTLKLARHVDERSMMIVDESTYIKGPRAKRTDRLTKIASVCRYRLVMTGTPLTQGLVDLFAQMRFLSEKILGYRSFWSFEQAHVRYRCERKVLPHSGRRVEVRTNHVVGYRNVEALVGNVAPYVFQVRKEDCLDLPDKVFVERRFDMTPEQSDLYELTKREMILDRPVDDFFGSSASIAMFRLFGALQRITAGIATIGGGPVGHDRVATLLAAVDQVPDGEPVVIWTKYKKAADQIAAALVERTGDPDCATIYDGRYLDAVRQRNLAAWRDRRHRFLLATQDSGGHGLTLVECAWTFFYADGFKYSNRLQAEDRFHRIGQTRRPTLVSIVCNDSIDERILENHSTKGGALAAFRQGLDREGRTNAKDRLMSFVGGRKL